jgi:hypothetical protein
MVTSTFLIQLSEKHYSTEHNQFNSLIGLFTLTGNNTFCVILYAATSIM